ncbi:MAG TPA: hypothetical protein VL172_11910 [Kofleriaceae bacterium]|jgi:hypothetical protein|nr:hypothetical protein [Kofleriaceae bacterium]
MRKLTLATVSALFLLAACNRASDKDVGKMIDLWNQVSDGYLKVLEANQKDPKKAIEEGQKYIDTDSKVQELGKMANLKGSQAQVDRFTKAVEATQASISTRIEAIAKAFAEAGDIASAEKLADQWKALVNAAMGEH